MLPKNMLAKTREDHLPQNKKKKRKRKDNRYNLESNTEIFIPNTPKKYQHIKNGISLKKLFPENCIP